MTENPCFPVEVEDYIATNYAANAVWVNHDVSKQLKKYNGENSQELVGNLIKEAHLVALREALHPGNSLDRVPKSLDDRHLPSLMKSIDEIETRLGVVDRQFTVADQLDILIIAETGIAGKNQQKLTRERNAFETEPKGDSRDKREMSLLTDELEESKRNNRIKEMTEFVTTLRLGPAAAPVANVQQTPLEYRL